MGKSEFPAPMQHHRQRQVRLSAKEQTKKYLHGNERLPLPPEAIGWTRGAPAMRWGWVSYPCSG
jgi:hypothetical protein